MHTHRQRAAFCLPGDPTVVTINIQNRFLIFQARCSSLLLLFKKKKNHINEHVTCDYSFTINYVKFRQGRGLYVGLYVGASSKFNTVYVLPALTLPEYIRVKSETRILIRRILIAVRYGFTVQPSGSPTLSISLTRN